MTKYHLLPVNDGNVILTSPEAMKRRRLTLIVTNRSDWLPADWYQSMVA